MSEKVQINIAICDDNSNELQHIQQIIMEESKNLRVLPETYLYMDGKKAVDLICSKKEEFDILFLDIDMPKITGLEAAKLIREAEIEIILIFISAHEQYVFDSFQYQPFRYIRKRRMEQEIYFALKEAYASLKDKRKEMLIVKTEESEVKIYLNDIMYCETESRKLRLYMRDGKSYLIRRTIKEFYNQLNSKNFIRIHSGCIVNVKYISGYSSFDITLDNGQHLIVSRARMKEVKTTLLKYWEC